MNSIFPGGKTGIFLLLEVPAFLIIFVQLWSKPFPVWVYFLAAAYLASLSGLFIALSSSNCGKRYLVLIQIILIAIVVRLIYFIATHFVVIPGGDPYWEYVALRSLLQTGKASVLQESIYLGDTLKMYSSWPGHHILAITLFYFTNLDLLSIVTLLPWFFFVIWFLFSYLLLRVLERILSPSKLTSTLAILAMATSPFFIPPLFWHQDVAASILSIIFYLAYKQYLGLSSNRSIMLLIITSALILVHNYTSTIAIAHLYFVSILIKIGQHSDSSLVRLSRAFFVLSSVTLMVLLLWWLHVANIIWPYAGFLINKFTETLKVGYRHPLEPGEWGVNYPASLIPAWGPPLLLLRDVILLILTGTGFMTLALWPQRNPRRSFIIFSCIAAVLFFAVDLVLRASPYRLPFLYTPFAGICIGLSFSRVKKRTLQLSVGILTTLLVFSSMTGLWGHRFLPVHLYDPNVNFNEAGEHSPYQGTIIKFLNERISYGYINELLTDDVHILSLSVPPEQLFKMRPINHKEILTHSPVLVLQLRGLNTHPYIAQGVPDFFNPYFDVRKFKLRLDTEFHLIYMDGNFAIWLKEW